jgi:hypothetical protein
MDVRENEAGSKRGEVGRGRATSEGSEGRADTKHVRVLGAAGGQQNRRRSVRAWIKCAIEDLAGEEGRSATGVRDSGTTQAGHYPSESRESFLWVVLLVLFCGVVGVLEIGVSRLQPSQVCVCV